MSHHMTQSRFYLSTTHIYIYILGVARYTDITVRYAPRFGGHGLIRFRLKQKKKIRNLLCSVFSFIWTDSSANHNFVHRDVKILNILHVIYISVFFHCECTQIKADLYQWLVAQSVPRKYPPHHYTTTTSWTVETRQDGSMRSLRQILTLHLNVAAEIETHQTRQRFPIFYCPIWWACANCSRRFLFLADRSSTRCGLLLL